MQSRSEWLRARRRRRSRRHGGGEAVAELLTGREVRERAARAVCEALGVPWDLVDPDA